MTYTKSRPDWRDDPAGDTPIHGVHMDAIEEGIAQAHVLAEAAQDAADAAQTAADASTAEITGRLSEAAQRAALVPFWTAGEVLTAGKVRMAPDGHVIQRTADGTAGASYDGTEQALWTVIGGDVSGLAAVATSGAYADLSGKPTIPAAYTDEQAQDAAAAALAAGTHTGVTVAYNDAGNAISLTATSTVATIPAGSTLTVLKSGGTWPARPTSRSDVVVAWKGADPSPSIVSSGTGGMLDNVDYRLVTP